MSTARAEGQRHRSVLAIDTTDGYLAGEVWDGPEADIEIVTFSPLPHDERILAMSSRSGFRRPFIWNPRSDERFDLACDELEGDVLPADWSPDRQRILLCQISRAQQQLHAYDLTSQILTRLQHPDGLLYVPGLGVPSEIVGPGYGSNEEIWTLRENSAQLPRIEAFDAFTGRLNRTLVKIDNVLPGSTMRSMAFIRCYNRLRSPHRFLAATDVAMSSTYASLSGAFQVGGQNSSRRPRPRRCQTLFPARGRLECHTRPPGQGRGASLPPN